MFIFKRKFALLQFMDNVLPAQRNFLFYFKRVSGAVLLLALSATFFFSAYTKSGAEFNPFLIKSTQLAAKAYKHSTLMTPVVFVQNILIETPKAANAFDSFQWTFLDLGINSILANGIIARLFIGLELMLRIMPMWFPQTGYSMQQQIPMGNSILYPPR